MPNSHASVIATLSDQLRRDISLGILRPGLKLNIESLKREFKVSHPSVREALSMLVGEGYVASEDHKGFRVPADSASEQSDIAAVRAELECLAFGWSVARGNTDWRASVVAAHYALSEAEAGMAADPLAYTLEWDERNRSFHMALLANCGSDRMLGLIADQYDLGRRYRLLAHTRDLSAPTRAPWIEKSVREHAQLKDAALAGDAQTGQRILRDHITTTLCAQRDDVQSPQRQSRSA